jgi:hypothetical protein
MPRKLSVIAVLSGMALIIIHLLLNGSFDADEIEHGHAAWMIANGKLPYRDFHQIHLPAHWILVQPILKLTSDTISTLRALRLLCLVPFGIIGLTTWITVAKVFPSKYSKAQIKPFIFFTLLSFAFPLQFYWFRPDPFMAAFVAMGIAIQVLELFSSNQRHFVCGLCLGFSASFSPKMFPLCLLVPYVAIIDRALFARKIWIGCLFGFMGFLAGIIPVASWIIGNNLSSEFFIWAIENNSQMVNVSKKMALVSIMWGVLFFYIILKSTQTNRKIEFNRPLAILSGASVLALAVIAIEPNHLRYNLQCALMPCIASLIGAYYLMAKQRIRGIFRYCAAVGTIAAIGLTIFLLGLKFHLKKGLVTHHQMQAFERCSSDLNVSCVGFAPFHPLRCQDASDLYLEWDLGFLEVSWVTDHGKEAYRKMWRVAVDQIIQAKPAILIRPELFARALNLKAITPDDVNRLDNFLSEFYIKKVVDDVTMYVNHTNKSCYIED